MRFLVLVALAATISVLPACSCASGPGGGAGPRVDGGVPLVDGASGFDGGGGTTILPDGAVVLPDGAVVDRPDSGVTPGTDGGTGPGNDAGPGCGPREICGNGLDDDCNGRSDENCGCAEGQVQDCYSGPSALAGVGLCRRGNQTCINPGGEFTSWGDCTGEGAPSAEVCDGSQDEDCDGTVDEGCGCSVGTSRDCYTGDASTNGTGPCHGGTQTCVLTGGVADWGPCEGEVTPMPELCDGMDYDCDGAANTGCICALGSTRSCYEGPTGTSGVGICHDGAQTCVPATGGPGADWGPCEGQVTPQADMCDGIDYTCTGVPGVGCACILGSTRACYGGAPGTRGVGTCHDGTNVCTSGSTGPEWSAACNGEVQPVAEICGNHLDDDCDGVPDDGCGGTIMCPGNVSVPAGDPIVLSPIAMGISTYSWRIVSAPTGGAATAVWAPTPPTAMTETFTPTIVGDYVIEISGTDAGGRTVTCQFTVTALPHGLRVQLTWDGAGDIDLHMHAPTTTAWFTTDDCYYSNRTPAWGASLDFDNTSQNGPENISMDNPVVGSTYTIAVHNWARGAGRLATVQIFCGSTTSTTPTATYTSRALNGGSSGSCSGNDFWTVASVRFTSATACTITPIGTYRTSSSACSSF
ncbi:MAG: MopE-related protein [Sandaracinus sp.]